MHQPEFDTDLGEGRGATDAVTKELEYGVVGLPGINGGERLGVKLGDGQYTAAALTAPDELAESARGDPWHIDGENQEKLGAGDGEGTFNAAQGTAPAKIVDHKRATELAEAARVVCGNEDFPGTARTESFDLALDQRAAVVFEPLLVAPHPGGTAARQDDRAEVHKGSVYPARRKPWVRMRARNPPLPASHCSARSSR